MGWFTKVTTFLKQGVTFHDAVTAECSVLFRKPIDSRFFFRQGMGGLCGVGGFWSFHATGTILNTTGRVGGVMIFDDIVTLLYR